MKRVLLVFIAVIGLMLLSLDAMASGVVVMHSGSVKSINKGNIELEYKNDTHAFLINKGTMICVDGCQVDSWRSLVNKKVATVVTEIGSNVALEIHDKPMKFTFTLSGLEPVKFSCKKKVSGFDRLTIRSVQKLLAVLQYDVGPIDSLMGPHTENAIRKFQRDYGYPETGKISEELLKQLDDVME